MKKLPLLVALGLFTLGTATVVKAEPGVHSEPGVNDVTLPESETPAETSELENLESSAEFLPADTNQDGIVDEQEAAAAAEDAATEAE